MTGIYCIENIISHKRYIGQSSNIERRWRDHVTKLANGSHDNDYLQRSWNKYGREAFSFYVVKICNIEELNREEVKYIALFNSYNKGFNLTKGGEGTRGCFHSDEYKQMMSDKFKGRKLSEETKAKIGKANQRPCVMTEAKKEGFKKTAEKLRGRSITAEHRQKISESLKGRIPWNKGKSVSKEQHGFYGKHHTDEVKEKISKANKGRKRDRYSHGAKAVVCVETGTIYGSISSAALMHGVTKYAISNAVRGKSETCINLHWEYLEEDI